MIFFNQIYEKGAVKLTVIRANEKQLVAPNAAASKSGQVRQHVAAKSKDNFMSGLDMSSAQ